MPVSVRTFASSGEAAAALSADRGARYPWRRHAGDARAERGRCLDFQRRARERSCADADRRGGTAGHDRRRRDLCAHPGRTRSRLPACPCPRDRRPGGAQHGRPWAAICCAKSVWRFHGRPARARRCCFHAGRPWQPRRADRGIPAIARAAGRHLVLSISCQKPASAEAFRYRKIARIKPKGGSVITLAAHLPMSSGRIIGARVALGSMAPTPIRARSAERALEGRSLDASTIGAAAAAAVEGTSPGDNALASAWYRREIVGVHLRRLLSGQE